MEYPEIFFLPILFFSDYFLTVYAAIQREKKHSKHFKIQHYELNPIWQKQINKKKWFNPKHILLTALLTAVILYLAEFSDLSDTITQALLGYIFIYFGMIIGNHLSNIAVFEYLTKNPNDLCGQITIAHSLALFMTTSNYLIVLIPIIFIAIFTPAPFVLGGLAGAISVLIVHAKWILVHKIQMRKCNKTDIFNK